MKKAQQSRTGVWIVLLGVTACRATRPNVLKERILPAAVQVLVKLVLQGDTVRLGQSLRKL